MFMHRVCAIYLWIGFENDVSRFTYECIVLGSYLTWPRLVHQKRSTIIPGVNRLISVALSSDDHVKGSRAHRMILGRLLAGTRVGRRAWILCYARGFLDRVDR